MPLPIKITVAETQDAKMTVRASRDARRTAFRDAGDHWHRTILPRHFTEQAKRRYGHQPRKPKTKARKIALARRGKVQMGGRVDNVWSGVMMRALLGHNTIRAFPSRVTVRMIGPRYISMRPFFSNQPDKAKEITTVTAPEQRAIQRVLDKTFTTMLRAWRASRKTTHGGK